MQGKCQPVFGLKCLQCLLTGQMSTYILISWLGDQFQPGNETKRDKIPAQTVFEVDRSQNTSRYSTLAVARSLYVRHGKVADKSSVIDYRTKAKIILSKILFPS